MRNDVVAISVQNGFGATTLVLQLQEAMHSL